MKQPGRLSQFYMALVKSELYMSVMAQVGAPLVKKVTSDTSDLWFDSHQQTHHCYIIGHFFQEIVIENRQNE